MRSKQIDIKNKLTANKILKVAPFDSTKTKTQAHRHNGYLELVLLTNAKGFHFKDGQEFLVQAPCLLVIKKDDVHHWELEKTVEGFVLLLKKDFADNSYDNELIKLLDQITKVEMITLENSYPLAELFKMLVEEENKTYQEGILKALLSKSLEKGIINKGDNSSNNDLFNRYTLLLQNETTIVNHVAYYAEKLHTTPQNLNLTCHKLANISASKHLATHIIKEAKRLLIYTNNTIEEIAYKVGFSDKSNFSKFFKRHVKETPSEFKLNKK
jgi:AraC family transcriptional activator of pobA